MIRSLLASLLFLPLILIAQDYRQLGDDLLAPVDGGSYGEELTISGDGSVLVVAAPVEGQAFNGVVRVYRRDGAAYDQIGEITTDQPGARVGRSIALTPDGTTLVVGTIVGAGNANGARLSPFTLVYAITADGVELTHRINAPIENGRFGFDVSVSDDAGRIAISVPNSVSPAGQVPPGRVYLFDLNGDGEYVQSGLLQESTLEEFGSVVELNGDGSVLAVGAVIGTTLGGDTDRQVYLYRFDAAANEFLLETTFARPDDRNFGIDVDLDASGDFLVIGENERVNDAADTGALLGYRYDGRQWVTWFEDLLPPATEANLGRFGRYVDLSGDASTIAVGSPTYNQPASSTGRAYIYKVSPAGEVTLQTPEIVGGQRDQNLGSAVAVSTEGNVVAIGQRGSSSDVDGRVSVYEEIARPVGVSRPRLELPGLALHR